MNSLWLLVALVSLGVGLLGERILRIRAKRQNVKLAALNERLDVYANYGKLAALRRAEVEESLAALRQESAQGEADIESRQAALADDAALAPMEFHCLDRIARGADTPLWYVAVEALDHTAPWTGVRHYAIAATSADEARKRIQERHPTAAAFAIAPAAPLVLPER